MPFNFNAKNVLLTYPQCPLSKEEVLEKLQAMHKVRTYTISEEKHSDGSPHIHAVICLDKRFHSSNERCFDLDARYHPNIKTLQRQDDVQRATDYVRKDGQFITNIQKVVNARALLAQTILEAGCITKKLILENPSIIFLNHSSITSWLNHVKKDAISIPQDFKKRRHLWVTGPSNSGKTYWLREFIKGCSDPQEIPANNDYAHVSPDTDCLYVDEYKGSLTVQSLNRLCDGFTRLNTKGGSTRINAPTVVVVSNYDIRGCYPKVDDTIYETLTNRFIEFYLPINSSTIPKFIKDI